MAVMDNETKTTVEFLPWYQPGSALMRCLTCGALVGAGDTELHIFWHGQVGV